MPLGVRIFLVYFLFVGLAGWFVLSTVMDEIRPGVRQSTEETLVDTANLLAEILRDEVKAGTLGQGRLPEALEATAHPPLPPPSFVAPRTAGHGAPRWPC